MKSKYCLVRMWSTFMRGTPSSDRINDSTVSLPVAAWVTQARRSEHCRWRNTPTGLQFWHQKHTEHAVCTEVKVLTQGGVKKHASDIQLICPHLWALRARAPPGTQCCKAVLFFKGDIDHCFVAKTDRRINYNMIIILLLLYLLFKTNFFFCIINTDYC